MIQQYAPLWREPLVIPIYFATASVALFLVQITLNAGPIRRLVAKTFTTAAYNPLDGDEDDSSDGILSSQPPQHNGFVSGIKSIIKTHGAAFTSKTLRLISSLILLCITIAAFILLEESESERSLVSRSGWKHKHKHKHNKHKHRSIIQHHEWIELVQCVFFTYTSLLAFLSFTLRPRLRRAVTTHISTLFLISFGIYAYRDLWPLATVAWRPEDAAAGWFTWSRVGVLAFAAVFLPLATPREYIPLDSTRPYEPTGEQTASPLSFIFFNYLDSFIFAAYRDPHLAYEKFPPLADYDRSEYLKISSFPKIDPTRSVSGKRRHIFFGLMSYFRNDYLVMSLAMTVQVLAGFLSPVAVNYLLTYIEKGGEGSVVRPWVWVISLFLSPMATSISMQMYHFWALRCYVRAEGILTQLIFEHSLRIHAAEASEDETSGSDTPNPSTESETSSEAANPALKNANLVGKINNLMSIDLSNVVEGRNFLFILIWIPLQIIISIVFLYQILGWSALFGVGFMCISFPLPGMLTGYLNNIQVELMKRTDQRVQAVTETLGVLRMIKLFSWESKVQEQMAVTRENELLWIRKRYLLDVVINVINYILPLLTMIITFASYTLIMGEALSAAKVFSSLTVFDGLSSVLELAFHAIPAAIQGKVSLDRINDFLNTTELLERYTKRNSSEETATHNFTTPIQDSQAIGFHNAEFTWSSLASSSGSIPNRRNFRLRIDGDLFFHRGKVNLILGPTGSGKTSLLLALLGELHFSPPGPDSWYNLPRANGVALCTQEPWVQNETIKDNILFGQAYDAERYKKVLYQCALEPDLALFEAGDETEVGEKGLTLSGGQKARVSLARAIYSSAEIILLDDVLSALDVHTAKWVVAKCFSGDLVRGRTLILVTHHIALATPIAQFVVSIGSDGQIVSQGSVSDALNSNEALQTDIAKEKEDIENEENVIDGAEKEETKPSGLLIVEEEVAKGHVSLDAFKLYIRALGGPMFWTVFLGGVMLNDFAGIAQTWFLGFWARQYEIHLPSEVPVSHYLFIYCLITLFGLLAYTGNYTTYIFGTVRASRLIHDRLIKSIMGTTLRFLDTTPLGRIINRFTQDIGAVDVGISQNFQGTVQLTSVLVLKFLGVIYMSPIFAAPGLTVAAIGGWLGNVYIGAGMAVKRQMSKARSPLFSHFNAAIGGLISIRAYDAEAMFINEALKRIDNYTQPARVFYALNRWIAIRADALGGLFAASLAAYLIYGPHSITASDTGFQLNLAVSFTAMLLWWVRSVNALEIEANSLERVQDYVDIEQEPTATKSGVPPAYWPASGSLVVENLSARYSTNGPEVLHGLSFEIKSGEKIGVVGRTGSGKSSLTLSLLRMIPTSGQVLYDGIPTDTVNLEAVRGNITIIPQQPELLSGSIRKNLDPFSQHDDAILNEALRSAGLFSLQKDVPDEEKIKLDTTVSSRGGNFSQGQRQILAMARALVRRSKVLILDEATASLDHTTDTLVQDSLSTEFKDCTLIIVAHRLHTIMDSDRILVLDAGRLAEFDSPIRLLQKEDSLFKGMVDGSGDRQVLYDLANGTSGPSSRK